MKNVKKLCWLFYTFRLVFILQIRSNKSWKQYNYTVIYQADRAYPAAGYQATSGRQFKACSPDDFQTFWQRGCQNAHLSNDLLFYCYQLLSCQYAKLIDKFPFSWHFCIFIHLQTSIKKGSSSPLIYFSPSGLKLASTHPTAHAQLTSNIQCAYWSIVAEQNATHLETAQTTSHRPKPLWPSNKKPLIYPFALLRSLFA